MKQLSIGREPDFLMKQGQVDLMHAVHIHITDRSSQSQTINIVDRSLFTVCLKVRDLLNAKSQSLHWAISTIGDGSEVFKIESNSVDARIFIHFPSQIGSTMRRKLSAKFLNNIREFSKLPT